MKKNYMMRLAAVLLVLVLLSTCVISGTFAKYVTSVDKLEDSATVAKWGIEMTLTGEDVLYDDNTTANDVTELKVATKDLAAPGTKEQLAKFEITGTPEVAYKISVETTLTLTGWEAEGAYYCPLVIKVNDVKLYGLDYSDAAAFKAAVEAEVKEAILGVDGKDAEEYDQGTPSDNTVVIEWSWAFEGTDGKQTNEKDSALGNAAANSTAATIAFTLDVTVEQVD